MLLRFAVKVLCLFVVVLGVATVLGQTGYDSTGIRFVATVVAATLVVFVFEKIWPKVDRDNSPDRR